MTRIISGLAALVAAFFLSITAAEALQCAPRDAIESWLKNSYGEQQAFVALNHKGDQLLVYLNPESGSWSAVLRPRKSPDLLCPLDSGRQGRLLWTVVPQVSLPAAPPPDAPALAEALWSRGQ